MTIGRDRPGVLNAVMLAAALLGAGLFVAVERKARLPLVRLEALKNPALSMSLAMSLLVAMVMMTTLVVGPFYLSRSLLMGTGAMGLALSVGPLTAALIALPAGRLVDRVGARGITITGLVGAATGCVSLAILPETFGILGYVVPVAVMTAGYALFQTANNTVVMQSTSQDQGGVVSGLLSLSRNLGLVTGASLLGTVFAFASRALEPGATETIAVASATRATFAMAAIPIFAALLMAGRMPKGDVNRNAFRRLKPALPQAAARIHDLRTHFGAGRL